MPLGTAELSIEALVQSQATAARPSRRSKIFQIIILYTLALEVVMADRSTDSDNLLAV
jgi:hypothetical protein